MSTNCSQLQQQAVTITHGPLCTSATAPLQGVPQQDDRLHPAPAGRRAGPPLCIRHNSSLSTAPGALTAASVPVGRLQGGLGTGRGRAARRWTGPTHRTGSARSSNWARADGRRHGESATLDGNDRRTPGGPWLVSRAGSRTIGHWPGDFTDTGQDGTGWDVTDGALAGILHRQEVLAGIFHGHWIFG